MNVLVGIFSHDSVWTIPRAQIDRLRRRFVDVEFDEAWSEDDILARVADADAAFLPFITSTALARASRLKWVHSSATAVGSLLSPEMVKSHVVVTNSRGVQEPLDPASPLWGLENVLITPHVSTARHDFWGAVVDLFTENLVRFKTGQPLLNVVNKETGY
jgi:phosphoglycerate dehydrogenase-like enzyme